jgi:hypothetical protein
MSHDSYFLDRLFVHYADDLSTITLLDTSAGGGEHPTANIDQITPITVAVTSTATYYATIASGNRLTIILLRIYSSICAASSRTYTHITPVRFRWALTYFGITPVESIVGIGLDVPCACCSSTCKD